MIQINLLPDVKKEYLHSRQVKHAVLVGSVLITALAVTLLILMFAYVQVVQPQHRKNVQHDIDGAVSKLKSKPNAVKIVTVQGALEQLSGLEDQKTITSRLFDYLKDFTPRNISYTQVTLDLAGNTLNVTGTTSDYEETNVLANNLKSAKFTYKGGDSTQTIQPFSAVVFQSLSRADQTNSSGPAVSFQLSFTFDPILFQQSTTAPSLSVNASSDQLLLPSDPVFSSKGANQ